MVGVMPAERRDVAWDIIRTQFVAGATIEELSKAHGIPFGTISARSSRESWQEMRPARKPMSKEVADRTVQNGASIWQMRADRSREGWDKITSKVREHLEDAPPDVLLAKADKAKIYNEIERKNLGLDKEQSNTHLQVGIQLIGTNDAPIEAELVDFQSDSV